MKLYSLLRRLPTRTIYCRVPGPLQ